MEFRNRQLVQFCKKKFKPAIRGLYNIVVEDSGDSELIYFYLIVLHTSLRLAYYLHLELCKFNHRIGKISWFHPSSIKRNYPRETITNSSRRLNRVFRSLFLRSRPIDYTSELLSSAGILVYKSRNSIV